MFGVDTLRVTLASPEVGGRGENKRGGEEREKKNRKKGMEEEKGGNEGGKGENGEEWKEAGREIDDREILNALLGIMIRHPAPPHVASPYLPHPSTLLPCPPVSN